MSTWLMKWLTSPVEQPAAERLHTTTIQVETIINSSNWLREIYFSDDTDDVPHGTWKMVKCELYTTGNARNASDRIGGIDTTLVNTVTGARITARFPKEKCLNVVNGPLA